jgi:hypothetical protein
VLVSDQRRKQLAEGAFGVNPKMQRKIKIAERSVKIKSSCHLRSLFIARQIGVFPRLPKVAPERAH